MSGKSKSRSKPTKQRTQKTAAKRVKRTATGKLKTRQVNKSHLLTRKASKRKRRLRRPGLVSGADLRQFNRLVPKSTG